MSPPACPLSPGGSRRSPQAGPRPHPRPAAAL